MTPTEKIVERISAITARRCGIVNSLPQPLSEHIGHEILRKIAEEAIAALGTTDRASSMPAFTELAAECHHRAASSRLIEQYLPTLKPADGGEPLSEFLERVAAALLSPQDGTGAVEKLCDCFGDSGHQGSTHSSEGRRCCDFCGLPIETIASSEPTYVMPLDTAWGKINALGGTVTEYDDFGRGINHAVSQALDIIEELGGQDPLKRREGAQDELSKV